MRRTDALRRSTERRLFSVRRPRPSSPARTSRATPSASSSTTAPRLKARSRLIFVGGGAAARATEETFRRAAAHATKAASDLELPRARPPEGFRRARDPGRGRGRGRRARALPVRPLFLEAPEERERRRRRRSAGLERRVREPRRRGVQDRRGVRGRVRAGARSREPSWKRVPAVRPRGRGASGREEGRAQVRGPRRRRDEAARHGQPALGQRRLDRPAAAHRPRVREEARGPGDGLRDREGHHVRQRRHLDQAGAGHGQDALRQVRRVRDDRAHARRRPAQAARRTSSASSRRARTCRGTTRRAAATSSAR